LVELEELEQMEKLFLYLAQTRPLFLRDIEKLIGLKIPTENIAGFEPDPKASKPIKQGQGRQQRNSTPRQPKTDSPNRSGNNSFGPRRNNDRRSN
jgi:ATP-dependent RNA helicase RhlE